MSLIATARALDDARFLWRVNAAVLTVASNRVKEPDSVGRKMAARILDDPGQRSSTIAALVACDPAVSAAVEVDNHNTVNTDTVTDQMILDVVGQVWDMVAARQAARTGATA